MEILSREDAVRTASNFLQTIFGTKDITTVATIISAEADYFEGNENDGLKVIVGALDAVKDFCGDLIDSIHYCDKNAN